MTRLLLLGLIATAVLAIPVATAAACSCAGEDPQVRMTRADAAFIGTVTERRAPAPFDRSGQARYTFAVEQVYKGRLDSTITVMTDESGASCGLELEEGDRTGLFLRKSGSQWEATLCDQAQPEEVRAGARSFPAAPGNGTARLLVAGAFHDAGAAALDRRGRLVGWVYGSEGDEVSACPGSRYAVQAGDTLSVIRLADLKVVHKIELPGDFTQDVRCLDTRGRRAVAVTSSYGNPDLEHGEVSEPTRLVRVRGLEVSALVAFRHLEIEAVALGRRRGYVAGAARGVGADRVLRVDYRSGATRSLGISGSYYDSMALSPDGRRLALLDQERSRLVLLNASTGTWRSRALKRDGRWRPVWIGRGKVAVVTGGAGRVYDSTLRRVDKAPAWGSPRVALLGQRLWWAASSYGEGRAGVLRSARVDATRVETIRGLRLPGATSIITLPEGAQVQAGRQGGPSVGTGDSSARAACVRAGTPARAAVQARRRASAVPD